MHGKELCSFYKTHLCGYSASEKAVFVTLPPEITIASPSPDYPNSITLTFEDKAKAIDWEQKMILWKLDVEEDDIRAKSQLSLVTVWKVDDFQKRLGLSKHDSDDEQGTVFVVDVVHRKGRLIGHIA